jgi:hypothetical protein
LQLIFVVNLGTEKRFNMDCTNCGTELFTENEKVARLCEVCLFDAGTAYGDQLELLNMDSVSVLDEYEDEGE